jgi:zinc protease
MVSSSRRCILGALILVIVIGAAAATQPAATAAASDALLPFAVTERTLPNGLKVIVVPTGFPNIVSLQIPVLTGSRNEVEPGKSGFAHFFEHMMFRGTKAYPAAAYQRTMTLAGAQQNAYTTDDYTNYHVTFAREDLETILKVEADRFQHLAYSAEDFKTESRAVLGEYNKNAANPISRLIEAQRKDAFTTHTYRHTTMGFLEDIEDMPNQLAYSKVFFDRWYRPEHTALIIAGDVQADEVLPLVERYWGGWARGSYQVQIPQEPPPSGPKATHVAWDGPTLPWVTVAFHGPAFSVEQKDYVAIDTLMDLTFGPTSPLYKRLVQDEQKVDQLFPYFPAAADPHLSTVIARVKTIEDTTYVRDAILAALAEARHVPPSAQRLQEAKSNTRYGLLRTLDNTAAIGALLARYVRFTREYDTLERLFRAYDALTPADLAAAAQRYVTDARLVQATLAREPLPPPMQAVPALDRFGTSVPTARLRPLVQPSVLPQLNVKLMFRAGSAHDPRGKEGLAALTGAMIAEAGSEAQRYDEIQAALFPIAGSFTVQVDKEVTTFTARVHRDNWDAFAGVVLPMLTEPGFRDDDFARLKAQQRNALVLDLRTNNEEELGKERLQTAIFAGTPYGHPVLGTTAGIEALTIDDVREFARRAYTRAALEIGLSGDLPEGLHDRLAKTLARLPDGPAVPEPEGVRGRVPGGLTVDIIEKDTRSTAISFGHPIEVTRSHPDYPALYLARTWLGEHRSSMSHLYQRIREVRGMNYGNYAYIEAFPRGMFLTMPQPHILRRAQLFEVWIRPVMPENAPMALRIALHELRQLIDRGLTPEQFEATRTYVMKNVFLLTATQDNHLGYALDSKWYGIAEFPAFMRERLAALTVADVNRAMRRHVSGEHLHVVVITKDAEGLREALLADRPARVTYDAPKPAALLAEDRRIGAMRLHLRPEAVSVTPVAQVFER